MKTQEDFLKAQNTVIFQHFNPGKQTLRSLNNFIATTEEQDKAKFKAALKKSLEATLSKFARAEVARQIKVIYLFITEGYYHELRGEFKGHSFGKVIKATSDEILDELRPKLFKDSGSGLTVRMVGLEELSPLLARVEAVATDLHIQDFLLPDGKDSYDTPKIASAIIQLARLPLRHTEMFMRIDDDVTPNEVGILNLKKRYYKYTHQKGNKHFCISWNYESISRHGSVSSTEGPDYETLFKHYVNSYSIRTTFLATPDCRCEVDDDLEIKVTGDPDKKRAYLHIIGVRFFLELFEQGKWGSDLKAPISGAGMCFSAEALRELPPWCNADALIVWIDDMIKWELMAAYYQKDFITEAGLLIKESGKGFPQDRNQPDNFTRDNVAWSVNTYLDRLLMGCVLAFAVNPGKFNPALKQGFGQLIREKSYLAVKLRWQGGLRKKLHQAATEHACKILKDWHYYFCEKADAGEPGYFTSPPRQPDGFTPLPADTPFNAYTLKQLIKIKSGAYDHVDTVFNVLDRYLRLKYEFWPRVVGTIAHITKSYNGPGFMDGIYDWLFEGLDAIGEEPRDPKPSRVSTASYALITREIKGKDKWLLQWNEKWQVMNLISGHHEPDDPNELCCLIREIHEELASALPDEELRKMRDALRNDRRKNYMPKDYKKWKDPLIVSIKKIRPMNYIAYSGSKNQWTKYELTVFDVKLNEKQKLFHDDPFYSPTMRTSPKRVNEWASREDIRRGYTIIGRPISPTVERILKECEGNVRSL